MRGTIRPLPNNPSWRGDSLKEKAQGQLYLLLSGIRPRIMYLDL